MAIYFRKTYSFVFGNLDVRIHTVENTKRASNIFNKKKCVQIRLNEYKSHWVSL